MSGRQKYDSLYYFGGIFITLLTNILYKTNLTDQPNCYKLIKSNILKSMNLECERFEFCFEVTAKLVKQGISIHEVPIRYSPRGVEEGKKLNWRDGFKTVFTLFKFRVKK